MTSLLDGRMRKMSLKEDQFLEHLITLDGEMGQDDIHLFKFICQDHIGMRKLEEMSVLNIFHQLKEQAVISAGDVNFLVECLGLIHRFDLIKKIGFDDVDGIKRRLSSSNRISSFRKLQVDVALELDGSEFERLKVLLGGKVPKERLEKSRNILDLFICMEKEWILTSQNTELLREMLQNIRRADLIRKIQEYHSEIGQHAASRKTVPSCCVKIVRPSAQVDVTYGLSQQDEVLADRSRK